MSLGDLLTLNNDSVRTSASATFPTLAPAVFGSNIGSAQSVAQQSQQAVEDAGFTLPTYDTPGHYNPLMGPGFGSGKRSWDYYNADLARQYGMDQATAYQEALSNTSYQRAVNDLKAAGLNPVLAMGKVNGADVFSGAPISSGGGSGGGSSGKKGSSAWTLKEVGSIIGSIARVVASAARFL